MNEEIKNEEVINDEVIEEVVEDAVNTDEVSEDANPEKTDEEVASDSEVEEDASKEEEVEESSEEAPKEEEPSEDAPTDTPVEGEEVVEEEKEEDIKEEEIPNVDELKSQIDDLKFEQEMQVEVKKLSDLDSALLDEATKSRQAAQQALEMAAQKFDIPLDKSMADLEKEDPKKAALAKELLQRTEAMLQQRAIELEKIREDEAAKVVFKKAERLFNKFDLNQEQAMVAAETFIDIIRATGVDDLGEDLKNKVELAVAKALMKHPIVMEVHDKIEEIKMDSDKDHSDTSDSKVPSEKIEEEEIEEIEEKEDVPPTPAKDLSAYMEGAADGAISTVSSVNIDNVLDLLASTPFKERTAFYKEHQELINQAMSRKMK